MTAEGLLENASDERDQARLRAAFSKESGAWLQALPVSSLGLRMDDNTVRVAIGLRLGSPLCRPHICHHCGAEVDGSATHGLHCRWSEGRHYRHTAFNDIVHRALSTAKIPSRLEPAGIYRSDGKRPDGITVVPWERGQLLVWDATCSDTFAPSYTTNATREAGAVAALAEERKKAKYQHFGSLTLFCSHRSGDSGSRRPSDTGFPEGPQTLHNPGHRRCAITLLPHTESVSGNPKGECSFSGWYIWSVSYSGLFPLV